MRPPEQLLYDSEASLRLVDHAIEELSESGAELDADSRGFLEHVTALADRLDVRDLCR